MKRMIIFTMVMTLILGLSGFVSAEDNFTKANNFMKINRLDDAISALEAQIALKSNDAKAYFMLGDIHLQQNNFAGADEEFQAAITFQPGYRAEVGKKFYAVGLTRLNNGEVDLAEDLFQRTLKQDPAQAKNMAGVCLTAAKKYFAISQPEKAEKLASLILPDKVLAVQFQTERTKYGENIIRQSKNREEGLKAVPYVGQARVDAVFPAPKWETVFGPQEYTGQGIVGKVFIPTAQSGKDYVEGDKIIVSGTKFRVYNGVWEDCQTKYEVFCRSPVNGKFFYIAAEEGVKVTVEVQRFSQPSKRNDLVTLVDFSSR